MTQRRLVVFIPSFDEHHAHDGNKATRLGALQQKLPTPTNTIRLRMSYKGATPVVSQRDSPLATRDLSHPARAQRGTNGHPHRQVNRLPEGHSAS